MHGDLPPYEAFTIGGTNSVRGYTGAPPHSLLPAAEVCFTREAGAARTGQQPRQGGALAGGPVPRARGCIQRLAP